MPNILHHEPHLAHKSVKHPLFLDSKYAAQISAQAKLYTNLVTYLNTLISNTHHLLHAKLVTQNQSALLKHATCCVWWHLTSSTFRKGYLPFPDKAVVKTRHLLLGAGYEAQDKHQQTRKTNIFLCSDVETPGRVMDSACFLLIEVICRRCTFQKAKMLHSTEIEREREG